MGRASELTSLAIAALAALAPTAAFADPASVIVTVEQDLRFGRFAVPSGGSRTVTPAGAVITTGLLPFPGEPTGPARVTILFDRGNESRRSIDVLLQVMIVAPQNFVQGGITGTLSGLATDLAGAGGAGQTVTLTISGCQERRCSRSFNVGGRIDITRASSGGSVRVPLSATATILQVK